MTVQPSGKIRRQLLFALTIGALSARSASAAPVPLESRRRELLAKAEVQLQSGRAQAALNLFELAAALVHSPDAEIGIVRALMQLGQFRTALSFIAHTAGAHKQTVAGTILYAWLLGQGGQLEQATAILANARSEFVDIADLTALETVAALLKNSNPAADLSLLSAPLRLAPYAHGAAIVGTPELLSSAVLLDEGRAALCPQIISLSDPTHGADRRRDRRGVGEAEGTRDFECRSGPSVARGGSPGGWVGHAPDRRAAPSMTNASYSAAVGLRIV